MDVPYFYIALVALPNKIHGVNTNIVTNLFASLVTTKNAF